MAESESKEGIHKVVSADALEFATSQGWQMVQVLLETEIEDVVELAVHPNAGNSESGYNSDTITETRGHEIKVHRFLLRKGVELVIGELTEQLRVGAEKLKASEEVLETKVKEVEAKGVELETVKIRRDELAEIAVRLEAKVTEAREAIEALKKSAGQFEMALDTVRQEIGTQEVKRILAAAEEDDGQSLQDVLDQVLG